MNPEIEFSLMKSSAVGIRELLDEFQGESGVRVRLRLLDWDSAWSDLIKVALYSDGPDISEIGTTWLGDLVAMNSLYDFTPGDLDTLQRGAGFFPSAWQSTRLVHDPTVWAIPWVTGVRLLFFRRELLARVGIEEQSAFSTAEALEQTLRKLQAKGIRVPWTIPTGMTHTTLHNIGSWVWGAGGDFITPDGKRTLFTEPEAQAGLLGYFTLGRYLSPTVQHLNGLEPDGQFLDHRETALTISGIWLFKPGRARLGSKLGVALPPGPSFVGGSHLVIWKHSSKYEHAFRLIQFLTRPDVQARHSQNVGLLPARLEAISAPPFSSDPLFQLAARALQAGRSFPVTRSWGLMEDRLTAALAALWQDALTSPEEDLPAALTKRLEPLARRLDLVLGQS